MNSQRESGHRPVLAAEVIELLRIREDGTYLDGTAGSGGHAALILERLGPAGRLVGIDRDNEALDRCRQRFAGLTQKWTMVHGNFSDMEEIAAGQGIVALDGIVLDLGVSSEQLGTPRRGFSFMEDGPLDMRMDPEGGTTAADIVNGLSESELERILRLYGEEPAARRVVRALVMERQRERIGSTLKLADAVSAATGGRRGKIHPATRTFQALRIAVNGELEALESGLEAGLRLLKPGGRMAVISFHSLEDRLVKNCFREHAGRYESLQGGGSLRHVAEPEVTVVTRKPVTALQEETAVNPRARSAKLRVAERKAA